MAAKKSGGAQPATGASATKKAPAKAAGAPSAAKRTAAAKTAPAKTASTKMAKTATRANGVRKAAVAKKTATKSTATPPGKTAATPAARPTKTTSARATAPSAPKKTVAKAPKSAFTAPELREFGKLIDAELADLQREYDAALIALDDLQHNRLDTAGDDPADAGNKTFEREQEMSIANNRLHLITQLQRARVRIDEGSYGLCENCGKTIPKARLRAFPSATLCVDCKAREERR